MSQRAEASIVAHFSILEDPRIERHKKHKMHNLVDILVPLYLLCFCASNIKGGKVAVKIAQDLLKE